MADFRPTLDQVKGLIATRMGGQDFSADTIPTADEAQAIVDFVYADVFAGVADVGGSDAVAGDLVDVAKYAVALGAAAQIELTFWPEQQQEGGTAALLLDRYRDTLARLHIAMKVGFASSTPLSSFPEPCPYPDPVW